MKSLLSLFRGRATRKNTQPISVVRMQALGVLKIYLEHAFKSPATLTQVDIAVTPVEDDAAGVHCDVMIEAFFYCESMEKRYGREGDAPLPPKITAEIRFRADSRNVLCWETKEVKANIENTSAPRETVDAESPDTASSIFMIGFYNKTDEFDRQFKAFRPYGRPILGDNHDQVVWTINGPGR